MSKQNKRMLFQSWSVVSTMFTIIIMITSDLTYSISLAKADPWPLNPLQWCWNPWKTHCPYRTDTKCIYTKQFCDGKSDCELSSDEDPKFCQSNTCSLFEEKCPGDLQCIDRKQFCDGFKDCM